MPMEERNYMIEITGRDINNLYVGRKVFFKNEYDEIPFVYEATIKNIHPYNFELECLPIPESVVNIVVPALMHPHIECTAVADILSSDSKCHIYKGIAYNRDFSK